MKTIRQTVHISAKPQEVYEVFVDAKKHGELTGENMELVKGKKIVQKWRGNDWPEGNFSDLTITLEVARGGTKLTLTQENIPDDKADEIDDGWYEYYWKPMNEYFAKGKAD